jgi:hypothetical protein
MMTNNQPMSQVTGQRWARGEKQSCAMFYFSFNKSNFAVPHKQKEATPSHSAADYMCSASWVNEDC